MENNNKLKHLSKKENIFIWGLVVLTVGFTVFAFVAPLYLTKYSTKYDFTNTGQIGDTIGGIMNPFISLAGVLITFLAFYIQYKANQTQIKLFEDELKANKEQFQESLRIEKEKEERNEKKEYYYYLSLLQHTLELILKDFEKKIGYLKAYYEKQKINKNFEIHDLIKLSSKNYINIDKDIDKLALYKGFRAFFNKRSDWLEEYMLCYDTLTHLGHLDKNIKTIYDNYKGNKIKEQKKHIEFQIETFISYCKDSLKLPDYQSYLDSNEEVKRILEDFANGSYYFERAMDIQQIKEDLFLNFQEYLKTLPNYSMIQTPISRAFSAKIQIEEKIPTLSYLISQEADTMERFYKEIIVKNGYYRRLKKVKLILDKELTQIDIENL